MVRFEASKNPHQAQSFFLLPVIQDISSQLELQHHAYLSASILPSMTMDKHSETFFKLLAKLFLL